MAAVFYSRVTAWSLSFVLLTGLCGKVSSRRLYVYMFQVVVDTNAELFDYFYVIGSRRAS